MNLLVINDLGIVGGGTEKRVGLLLQELLRIKAFGSIHLLEHESSNSKKDGIIVHKCNAQNAAKKTREIIEESNIDVVQAHNLLQISAKPIVAAKKLGRKVVWFAHDYWVICAKRVMLKNPEKADGIEACNENSLVKCILCGSPAATIKLKIEKSRINKADLAIASADFVRGVYEKHGVLPNKWRIVAPWIDTEKFKNAVPSLDSKVVLFVGPLLDYKGAFVAVKAMKNVLEAIPKAKLWLVGGEQEKESRYRKRIELLARNTGVDKNIVFRGSKDWLGLVKEFESCAAYVCPTIWQETFGLNWAEAMCAGLPVIATQMGSIPEISAGKAILVKAKDAEVLGSAIVRVLSDKKLAEKMSHDGKIFASTIFNIKRAAKEMLELYKSLETV